MHVAMIRFFPSDADFERPYLTLIVSELRQILSDGFITSLKLFVERTPSGIRDTILQDTTGHGTKSQWKNVIFCPPVSAPASIVTIQILLELSRHYFVRSLQRCLLKSHSSQSPLPNRKRTSPKVAKQRMRSVQLIKQRKKLRPRVAQLSSERSNEQSRHAQA